MTTTDPIDQRPATELAPEPAPDGTAAAWSTHFLARSLAEHASGRAGLLTRLDLSDPDPADVIDVSDHYERARLCFLLGLLYRAVDDATAREAAEIAATGEDEEWSWPLLGDDGLNADLIAPAPTRAERVENARQARVKRAAERSAASDA